MSVLCARYGALYGWMWVVGVVCCFFLSLFFSWLGGCVGVVGLGKRGGGGFVYVFGELWCEVI